LWIIEDLSKELQKKINLGEFISDGMATVMIIAGESSGELYGSLLAKALKTQWTDLHIIGIGGERMSAEGVTLISRTTDAFGLLEAVSSYRVVKATFKKAVDALKKYVPDVLVLIDYPDFNIRLARVARDLRIKILYYVSPQVWAWRKGRVKKIAQIVDRMAVLFPFEEQIYKKEGVDCEFVGHPIFEEIEYVLKNFDKDGFKAALGFDTDRPILSLLPGSRPHELTKLLPVMTAVVKQFKSDSEIRSKGDYQFCVPLASNTDEGKYRSYIEALRHEGVIITKGETVKVLSVSDLAVICSGTATLQAVFLEVPMVVIYKLSPFSYQVGKRIVKVKYISLINILSDKEVVKELIQDAVHTDNIIKELRRIMFQTEYREDMIKAYRNVKKSFSDKKTSQRVAEIVMEMINKKDSVSKL
jgi:lipid-A-disaccharide synthase